MKFGVREICDVVLKAKAAQKIGNKIFYAGEPVCYFDTLKTSSLEGQATTVYAQGGRGNARLVAWEGERTLTFTMEDALISPEGFMILTGAGLIEGTNDKPIYQHITETVDASDVTITTVTVEEESKPAAKIKIQNKPYLPADQNGNFAYVMFMKDGEIISEPYIPVHGTTLTPDASGKYEITVMDHDMYDALNETELNTGSGNAHIYAGDDDAYDVVSLFATGEFDSVLVDYYTPRTKGASQIEIDAAKFGGNYYLEASTLFRDQNGVDMPAEFIIPNCKVQSNFTFTMASSGDPSTFTFTLDAFPGYTRFDHSKKVLAAIQIINSDSSADLHRHSTVHEAAHDSLNW